MSDELELLNTELAVLHAGMRKRKASSYKVGEIEQLRNKQRSLLHRIEALLVAADQAPI